MERAEVRALVDRAQQAVWHGTSAADVALDDVSEQIVVEMQRLRAEIQTRRATVTTGGPAPAFTQQWENGPSTPPPTAPPEPEVVELPDCDCCGGDPNTVCDACGEHACWAGRFMCEDAYTAGIRDE